MGVTQTSLLIKPLRLLRTNIRSRIVVAAQVLTMVVVKQPIMSKLLIKASQKLISRPSLGWKSHNPQSRTPACGTLKAL